MSHSIGQYLGNYQLLRLLGQGGFALVYLGKHRHLGTHAAIKILNTRLEQDQIALFQQEARILAQLNHPHIVRVLDYDVRRGKASPGTTLFNLPVIPTSPGMTSIHCP